MVDPKVPKTEALTEQADAAAVASERENAKFALAKAEAGADAETFTALPDSSEAGSESAAAQAVEERTAPVELPSKAKGVSKAPARTRVLAGIAKVSLTKPASEKKRAARKPVIGNITPVPKTLPDAEPVQATKTGLAVNAKARPVLRNPAKPHTNSQLKENIMATTTQTPDFAKGFQDAIANMQIKAKTAFENSTASMGEAGEFAKGNVEALVESGKILAAGVQELGTTYVSESRSAFESLTADVKELASATSPADFMKLQSELMRRNLDAAVAAGSKNTEAMLKLVNEAFAPISGRFSLAAEKIKKAA